MNLEKIFRTFTILEFISSNPNCSAPDVRDFLGIIHSTIPSKEEKGFYRILTDLDKMGFILKLSIKKLGSTGSHFALIITGKGKEILSQLKHYSSKNLKDKGRYSDDKKRKIILDSMLKIFSRESFDIIFNLIQEITGVSFEYETIQQQEEIIKKVNETVSKISNRASEITESFF